MTTGNLITLIIRTSGCRYRWSKGMMICGGPVFNSNKCRLRMGRRDVQSGNVVIKINKCYSGT